MTFITKLGIGAGITAVLLGAFLLWKRGYDNDRRLEGKLEILTQDLKRRDSALTDFMGKLGVRLDAQLLTANKTIERFRTVTEVVQIPGRVDSVFKDSAFANLPDSAKVRILRELGTQVANACSEALNTCTTFKDSAQRQFRIKDSLVRVANVAYSTKPRRPCGIGATVGPIAGFARIRRDTVLAWRPVWGIGGSTGVTCSF